MYVFSSKASSVVSASFNVIMPLLPSDFFHEIVTAGKVLQVAVIFAVNNWMSAGRPAPSISILRLSPPGSSMSGTPAS